MWAIAQISRGKGKMVLLSVVVEWVGELSAVGSGIKETYNWGCDQRGTMEMVGNTLGR